MSGRAEPAARSSPAARRWSDLLPRLLSALVLGVLALGTALAGGQAFVLFWLLAAAAVLWEWQHLLGPARARARFAVGGAALAAAVALLAAGLVPAALALLLAGAGATAGVAPAGMRGMAVAGLAYAAVLAFAVIVLRLSFPGGLEAMLWLFAVVWGTDVMAYFGGRLVGGPKLWPRMSPGKTWSGFLIGIAAGACLGLAVAPAQANKPAVLAIGLVAGALAQGGDLFESGLKRRYGVKDSGRLIPGHGGVMDRLDGFVVAAAFAAALGVVRMGLDAAGAGLFNW